MSTSPVPMQLSTFVPPIATEWEVFFMNAERNGGIYFPEDIRTRIANFFNILDISRRGLLTDQAFHDPIPSINLRKQEMWIQIRNLIDFYGNASIDPQEFILYFMLKALRGPYQEEHSNSLSEIILRTRVAFIRNLNLVCDEFEHFLNGI